MSDVTSDPIIGAHTPNWKQALADAWHHNQQPAPSVLARAARYGIPKKKPSDPLTALRVLAEAGVDLESIEHATGIGEADIIEVQQQIHPALPEMWEIHAWGFTVAQIAAELDVTRPWVYYHLKKRGVAPNVARRPAISAAQKSAILDAFHTNGERIVHIARRMDLSPDQVRNVIRRTTGGK